MAAPLERCYHGASLAELQQAQREWSARQPWDNGNGPTLAFIGMIEELAEMSRAVGIPAGADPSVAKTIMLMDQLGRYAHATLKRLQGIRGMAEQHQQAATEAMYSLADLITNHERYLQVARVGRPTDLDAFKDGYGDLSIYAFDCFNELGESIEGTVSETCEQVFARDWSTYPQNGRTA